MTTTDAPEATAPAITFPTAQAHDWTEAPEERVFLAGWLNATRRAVTGVQAVALVVEETGGDALRPVGLWPEKDAAALEALGAVIGQAVARPGTARQRCPNGRLHLATAIRDGGRVVAVAALTVLGSEAESSRALQLASGWVAARIWQRRITAERARFDRGFGALDLMAAAAERRGLKPAAMALASELALWLPADRAAVGLSRRQDRAPRLLALSGGAWFRRNALFARALEDAMAESMDQDETVVLPRPEGRPVVVDAAHGALLDLTGGVAAATVPLRDEVGTIGAIAVEWGTPPSEDDLLRLEAVAALTGPLLGLKAREDRWISGWLPDLVGRGLYALTARHRPSYRLAALAIVLALALPAVLQAPLRLGAEATLRGAQERAVVSAVSGFIAHADIRPGQVVQEGDLLVALDDRDLALEAERLQGDIRRLRTEARRSLAEGDAGGRALAAARLDAAEAEFALAVARLDRVRITAPVTGRVISGDHRRRLGAPVEAGELLHEIAAGTGLRVVLGIDERDLALVAPGMRGALALSSEPGLQIPLQVIAVTPVAREHEGRRLFAAEAHLTGPLPPDLVPGMEGFARLDAEERRLWSIWTRRARDWIVLQVWRWRP